jgi:hypothetical protein
MIEPDMSAAGDEAPAKEDESRKRYAGKGVFMLFQGQWRLTYL